MVLLGKAKELLAEKDAVDVSLSELAERSGLNAGLVRYYFGNKEGLLLAVLKDATDTAKIQIRQLIQMPWSPIEKLRVHLEGTLNTYYRAPYLVRLMQVMLRDASPQHIKYITDEMVNPVIDLQSQIISEGVRAGLFYPVDQRLFYLFVKGACDGLYSSRAILKSAFGLSVADIHRDNVNQVVALIMRGVLRSPGSADLT